MDEENLTSEQYLLKAKGVHDCVKWMGKKIKEEQSNLEGAKQSYKDFGMFDDCGESYSNDYTEAKAIVKCLIGVKISLEKYEKKLKHMAEEV